MYNPAGQELTKYIISFYNSAIMKEGGWDEKIPELPSKISPSDLEVK
jgi:hypothetical protein